MKNKEGSIMQNNFVSNTALKNNHCRHMYSKYFNKQTRPFTST